MAETATARRRVDSAPSQQFGLTTGAAHTVRVTIRFQVGTFTKEADLSLPTASTFAELLPEVLEMVEAPQITRPWKITSAAGSAFDMTASISQSGISHGQVIIVHPTEPADAPIIRDSAEELVAQSGGHGARRGLTFVAVAASLLGMLIAYTYTSLALSLVIGAGIATLIVIWQRDRMLVAIAAVVLYCLAVLVFCLPETADETQGLSPHDWGMIALTMATTAVIVTLGLAVLKILSTEVASAFFTVALLVGISFLGVLLPAKNSVAPVAALAIVLGLVCFSLYPTVITALAGLEVPRLPTAGQDFSISDEVLPGVDTRARRARAMADGVAIGIAVVTVPALIAVGLIGGLSAQLLAVVSTLASALHAARIRPTIPAWAMTAVVLASLIAVGLATERSWPTTLIAAGVFIAVATSCVWANRVHQVAPTTAVWWERTEYFALIMLLPMAAWAGELIAAVRGIG